MQKMNTTEDLLKDILNELKDFNRSNQSDDLLKELKLIRMDFKMFIMDWKKHIQERPTDNPDQQ